MKRFSLLLASASALALPACQNVNDLMASMDMEPLTKTETRADNFVMNSDCPTVEVVEELRDFSDFTTMSAGTPAKNLISRATVKAAESSCSYGVKSVTLDMKLAFNATLGPQGRAEAGNSPFFSYPFFVAVTSPSGRILAKEVFSASISFENGKDSQTYFESMRQIIPIPAQDQGPRHKILVGFQLSQDQLDYNRAVIKREKEQQKAKERQILSQPPQIQRQGAAVAPAQPSAAGSTATVPPVSQPAPVNIMGTY